MAEYDPTGPNGHHLLPMAFEDEFAEIFEREDREFDIHDHCSVMYAFQHLEGGIHPGWNADWQSFFDWAAEEDHQLTVDDVYDHLQYMRVEYEIDDRPVVHYDDTGQCDPFDGSFID